MRWRWNSISLSINHDRGTKKPWPSTTSITLLIIFASGTFLYNVDEYYNKLIGPLLEFIYNLGNIQIFDKHTFDFVSVLANSLVSIVGVEFWDVAF